MMAEEIDDAHSSENIPQALTKCGHVVIVGRPNVGRSTLINHLLGQKICITSRKPQTTRYNMLGIKTENAVQVIYVDTPGMHQKHDKALNRYMNRSAANAVQDVDAVVFIVDKDRQETLVNYHMQGDYLVIHDVAKQFTLRDGSTVTSIYNDLAIGDSNRI